MCANSSCAFLVSALIAMAATSSASAQLNTPQYTSVAAKGCKKFENTKVPGGEITAAFDCKKDTVHIVGNRGHAAELAARQ